MVARRAHNPKVVGSNPAPATKFKRKALILLMPFCYLPYIEKGDKKNRP
ncbi:unknown [[Mannheimia] succiniciproducens MBEL55E]|uniref:Uncharacterized protein n=1 Tax=Mannheimia succiniciproducens (strain KCTC 0769BP / MBEL55E) TaxID=221988 RepID=Q65SJ3_MANSM|nr:unknown [[Mannheimia] succiniciproducens MBEL55E]